MAELWPALGARLERQPALASRAGLPLEPAGPHHGLTRNSSCSATLDGHDDEAQVTLIRRDNRAITRGAMARPGAALIASGLLLLSSP
jgi:hypothetical protein